MRQKAEEGPTHIAHTAGIDSRLVNGDAVFSQRFYCFGQKQIRVPSAAVFLQLAPGIMASIDVTFPDLGDAQRLWLIPLHKPGCNRRSGAVSTLQLAQ